MKKCFVISPIGAENSEIRKRADQLFKYIIKPVCVECDFEAIRVDQINKSDSITQTIIDFIKSAELVIADMTGHNPNAFYEIGYRASTGKPMIYLKEKGETIPFDIASIRAFEYDLQNLDAVEEIKGRLKQTIGSFNISENSDDDLETSNNDTANSQLLSTLFSIQDDISKLRDEIKHKDTETIQAIISASQKTVPHEDANTAFLKAIFPEILKNPDSMKNLISLNEMIKDSTNNDIKG